MPQACSSDDDGTGGGAGTGGVGLTGGGGVGGGGAGSGAGGTGGGPPPCAAERFGAETDFSLPDVGGNDPYIAFDSLGGSTNLPGDIAHYWATVDLTGDGLPDLVRTYLENDATVGNARWLLYANTGNGFAAGADFPLPDVGGNDPYIAFDSLGGSTNLPGDIAHYWTTVDLTSDGPLDLVRTYLENDATVGNARWLLYAGACSN